MNPNPQQISLIQGFVAGRLGGWGNTDAQIRAAMASTQVANPTTRATVPTPFTVAQLLGSLSQSSAANLNSVPGQQQLILDIRANDVVNCLDWIGYLATTAKITAGEAAALQAIVTATGPDPSWTATVAWDVGVLGRSVDDFDLETSRQGQ